jgi:GNAT superfamily N-acetyltransferase
MIRLAGGYPLAMPSDDPGIAIRRATLDDVDAMDAIAQAAEVPPPGAPSGEAGPTPGSEAAYLRHLLGRGRVTVAVADGQVVGFGASAWTGRALHLADLFVAQDRQGQGIGQRLLSDVMDRGAADLAEGHAAGGTVPRTTFASDDPRALPLYIRAGMAAWWPNLYLAGDPARLVEGGARTTDGIRVEPSSLEAIATYERSWAGVDRGPDLGYWASLAGGRALEARRDGVVVGVAFVRDRQTGPGRWIDHAVVDPGHPGAPILLALARTALEGAVLGGACVPGPSDLVPALLDAGFTIRDRDTFMASDPALVDPTRELVNTGFL